MARKCSREASSGTSRHISVRRKLRGHHDDRMLIPSRNSRRRFVARRFNAQDFRRCLHWYGETWTFRHSLSLARFVDRAGALADRAASRMLVLYRREQRWEDRTFRQFPNFCEQAIAWY